MKKIILKFACSLVFLISFTGCLKTRSEVSEQDQNMIYGKKNAENQIESQSEAAAVVTVVDEKDELIRGLNGRVEVLESQLAALLAEKEATKTQDAQRMALIQEALTKMELQVNNLEAERFNNKLTEDNAYKSSDDLEKLKPENTKLENTKLENTKPVKTVNERSNSEKTPVESKTKKLGSYEAAERYLSEQDWKKAIINFQKYTEESPRGKYVAEAKYKIGVCFQELGMKEEAVAFYEEVVANYADTAAGKKSKSRLRSFKK